MYRRKSTGDEDGGEKTHEERMHMMIKKRVHIRMEERMHIRIEERTHMGIKERRVFLPRLPPPPSSFN